MTHKCDICEYSSNRISNVKRHEENQHEYIRSENKTCFFCRLTFKTKREYNSHVNKYHLSAEQKNTLKLKAAGYRKKYKLKTTVSSKHNS